MKNRIKARCARIGTLVALMLSYKSSALAQQVHRNITTEGVEWFVTTIPGGKTQTFELTGPSVAQAAMHIFTSNGLAPLKSATGSTLTYTNPNPGSPQNVAVLIHSRQASTEGTVRLELSRDGAVVVARDIWLGGNPVSVPCGAAGVGPVDYEVAPLPGGQTDTIIFGFDSNWNALAYDNDSGVHESSRLSNQTAVCRVLVSHASGRQSGSVNLYVNDLTNDHDEDGLGALLEAELGTCDNVDAPGCSNVYNTSDTDRDGLDDMLELFGLDSTPPLLLPVWGANPLHKDLFMEVDAHPGRSVALNDAALRQIAELFAEGPADQLQNPDGQPGVSLHLDVGRHPTDDDDPTLFGDWGGSNPIAEDLCSPNSDGKYSAGCLRDQGQSKDMAKHRRGIFYYGISNPSGGGQASLGRGRGHFGPDPLNTAHELGHAIGLHHGGINSQNCKPNYPSLMNYATLYKFPKRFFSGMNVPPMRRYYAQELDPFGQASFSPPSSLTTEHLANENWLLGGDGLNADWNRDGVTAGVWHLSVQQAITENAGGGCASGYGGVLEYHQQKESEGRLSSPTLARLGHYFLEEGDAFSTIAFWVDGNGGVRFRAVRDDADLDNGGCHNGCKDPRDVGSVAGLDDITGVAATQFMQYAVNTVPSPHFGLALRDSSDRLRFALSRDVQLTSDGYSLAQELDPDVPWEFVDLGLSTAKTPELVQMTVNIDGQMQNALAIVYVDKATSEFHWVVLPATADPTVLGNWVRKGRLLDKNDQPLLASKASSAGVIGRFAPSVTSFPVGPLYRTLAAFGTGDERGYVYAYIAERDQWERRVSIGKIGGAPSIALAHERVGTALINGDTPTAWNSANPARARAFVSFKRSGNSGYPAMLLTKFFNVQDVVDLDENIPKDRTIGITSIWGRSVGTEPIVLYQDLYTAALRGALINTSGSGDDKARSLQFLPFVDGTRPGTIRARSDFEFMERHVCMGVRYAKDGGDNKNYCGREEDTISGL